jgi:D-amino-acid dehydrogenase
MLPKSATVAARYLLAATGTSVSAAGLYRYSAAKQRERLLPDQPLELAKTEKKHVIIIGGGVVGVTTAYKLGQAGYAVTILEAATEAASECSACAAGGMQRSNPVVDRKSWMAVLSCIFPETSRLLLGGAKDDYYFKFFHQAWIPTLTDPFFLRWLLTFTKTSLFPDEHQEDKQLEMLKFTKYAVEDMVRLMERRFDNMAKVSGYNTQGSVSVSYEPIDQKASANPTHSKNTFEPSRRLVGDDLLKEEPSLKWQQPQPTSARFEYESKSASSQRWTRELAKRCIQDKTLDVSILYDTRVEAIAVHDEKNAEKPRVSQIKTNRGVVDVPDDAKVVVAAGSWTPRILALMDLYVPVYPLKGYAMSVNATEALQTLGLKPTDLPTRIVCDKYMFTSRLGDEIRITSIGEFSGWNTAPTPDVDEEFRREAVRQFPQLQPLIAKATTWCGHRPFVNDGILLLGAADTHENLYVSCGPGSNGWKLAMGSGEVIERLVSGQSAQQIQQELGFDVNAFSPAGRVLNTPLFSKICRARWNV